MQDKYLCKECDHVSMREELLIAPNPFDTKDIILGCPICKSVDCFDQLCQIEGCPKIISGGHRSKKYGYLWTCYEHGRQIDEEENK